jgi:hypothetical protein
MESKRETGNALMGTMNSALGTFANAPGTGGWFAGLGGQGKKGGAGSGLNTNPPRPWVQMNIDPNQKDTRTWVDTDIAPGQGASTGGLGGGSLWGN